MALALCLTLLPATAQAEDGHQTHPICGKTCSHTGAGETQHLDAFENANWLASSYGKLRVGSPGGSIYGASLTEKDNYVILNEGYYYLSYTADGCDHSYVRSLKTIKIEGDVTICLNGKQIEKVGSTTGPVFEVPDRSTLTLTDCTGNGQIMCDSSSNGSGVYVNGGILNLYSGQITKSEGQTDAKSNKYGGGVYVKSGNFNMYGGSITGNSANYGGGVYVNSGTFTMDGGDITRNSASYVGGAGVYVEKNGNFIMNNDARVTENTIGYGSTGGSVYVNGGKFEMNGNASVTGNTAHNSSGSCGGGVYVNSGTFTMNGNASVTGNKATLGTLKGGGVYVEGGEFTMNGNSKVMRNAASGNKRIDGNGGGVYVKGGKFEMNGEETSVSNNTAATNGGGVYVEGGTFTMKGGTIGGTTDGEANTADQGGGVYVSSGTFTMSGGSITGNDGNGVFVHDNAATTFTVSGAPTVTENTREGAASNVFLAGRKTITIGNKLNKGASIGVTKTAYSLIADNVSEDYSGIFFSDNTQYKVEYDKTDEANHKLVLTKNAVSHTHKWEYTNVDKSTVSVTCKGASGSCDYTTTPATVTIRMAQPTYTYSKDMEAPKATLTYSDNWPKDVAKARESDITYWKSDDGGNTYTNLDDAPTAVGRYKASITVGGKTASVEYEITGGTTEIVPVSQITLNKTSTSISVGNSETLTATVAPENAANKRVTWTSSNENVATVDANGTVKALAVGTTKITATAADGSGKSATCTVTVTGGTTPSQPGGSTGGSSSGGGGGSSSDRDSSDSNPIIKTETKNNADGSTTKTETRKDGTVTQTTTAKDGSVSKTETKKDGSSVTENKAANGSTGTVKTDKNGQTEAKTALSNKAIEDAKKNGEAVKAPVEVKASHDSSTAPTVKVELPKGAGETKVEIPVSNVKSGTVAVLVHPDGTEEILKNSIPTEDGIQLTVDGNATVKIIDNSKDFIDTRNHWAKDAIDFVSARGLVNGMSATIYAPNASTTRAQLWTILARQNDADLSGGSIWYEKAQNWAKDKGVSDGANPNAAINRAQMVTMLWRAVGQPTAGSAANFTDVSADSYYAGAVSWAVENGITTGVGGGRFDPAATCTRAQIAAFLARLYAEK